MTDTQTRQRETNLELFRIISMLLIVAHHYVVNSGMETEMAAAPFAMNSLFFYLAGAWGKTGINCFVMITGYFMCRSRITLRQFLKLVLQVLFYDVVIYLIFVVTGYTAFSASSLLDALLPVRSVSDGFTSAFIVFFLFIPFLNVLLRNISEKMHLRLLLLCFFLYTFLGTAPGFSVTMNYVSWFTAVYFLAAYLRLYPKPLFERTSLWGAAALVSLAVSAACILLCIKSGRWPFSPVSDSNKFFAVTTAFCAFLFFKNVRIPYVRSINTVAGAAFGVLLIHANGETMRRWLWKDTLRNAAVFHTPYCYLHFFCAVIGIYAVCTLIDLVRKNLLEKPFFRFYDRHSGRLTAKLGEAEKRLLEKLHVGAGD